MTVYEITVDRQKDGGIFLGNDYLILIAPVVTQNAGSLTL